MQKTQTLTRIDLNSRCYSHTFSKNYRTYNKRTHIRLYAYKVENADKPSPA